MTEPKAGPKKEPKTVIFVNLPIQVLHRNQDLPAVAFVTERFFSDPLFEANDQTWLLFFATATRIYSFLEITIGHVKLRSPFALMTSGLATEQFPKLPPMPLHLLDAPNKRLPAGDFYNKIQLVGDEELNRAQKKFVRAGLWVSPFIANADSLAGHDENLYVIPKDGAESFLTRVSQNGDRAFAELQSFADPTLAVTDEEVVISPEALSKRPWARES